MGGTITLWQAMLLALTPATLVSLAVFGFAWRVSTKLTELISVMNGEKEKTDEHKGQIKELWEKKQDKENCERTHVFFHKDT